MLGRGKRKPPTPHLWDAEARANLADMAGEVGRVAREVVSIDWDGATLVAEVGTNPDWEPPDVDFSAGIEPTGPNAHLARIAERAITRRVLLELNKRDTLRAWVAREVKARKGNAALARALLGIEGDPDNKRQYRAMLRKVEEWRQGKYIKPARANARRVAALRGDLDGAAVAMLPRTRGLMVGVAGWWVISKPPSEDRWVYSDDTDEEQVQQVRAALANDGANLGGAASREAVGWLGGGASLGGVYLERLNGYHVEVDTQIEGEG